MNVNDRNVGMAIYTVLVALVPVFVWVVLKIGDALDRWLERRKVAAGGGKHL